MLSTALIGIASLHEAINALFLTYTFSAVFAIVLASRRGDRPGGRSLNAWDESLAFNALAMLGHCLQRLHG